MGGPRCDFLGGMGRYLDTSAPVVIELVNAFTEGEQVLAEWTSKATAANGSGYDHRCARGSSRSGTGRSHRWWSTRTLTTWRSALFPQD
ncbi:hypothetical protein [Streptomyces sp. NPDC037389]|uniref:hypothetical protein n=1 Tax=Streptomyces sp. NPDC037389 TaxID=3155369 RepID=UPI0033F91539